ncbi:MAG TPA: ABC transporter permease [Vicinamibacterales bacterium]|jgi:predicted permease|nr:ABC transporter permease [Vicinamibacterales bacterium]
MSIRAWLKGFARRRLDDDDFEEEIRAHLAISADERMADGADRQTARQASLKEFGNVTLTTEAARGVWTPWWVDALHDQVSDLRYAIRNLAKNPVFSLTVVGVLALGIGLNAAVFTMLKSMAFSPIAGVSGSARLSVIYGETSSGRPVRLSYSDYQFLRDHDEAFSGLFGSSPFKPTLGRGRNARQIWGELVTGNYFQTLGVRAELGRTLLPSDEAAPGRQPVIVLSDGLWRRDFDADSSIVGRTVDINNHPLTVVGVADPTFHGTTVVYDVEAFVPVTMAPELGFKFGSQKSTPSGILADRGASVFYPEGYLRSPTTRANASAQADALWATLSHDRPLTEAAQRLRVVPFWRTPYGAPITLLPTLGVLGAMALLVLLIACANIAGLVLVRGLSRRGEIAVRLALGATRTRIIRLLLVEDLVLALPGAVLGVVLAWRGIPVLVGYADLLAAPERVSFNIGVDGLVIGFAVLVACGSALVRGFVPALQSTRVDLITAINEDASPRGASPGRLRAGLVVTQVAVSLLLLVGAGLATRSVEAARRAYPGFDADHVTAVAVDVTPNGYDAARGRLFYRKLLDAARADPGVESVTLAAYTPLGFLDTPVRRVAIDGYESSRGEDLAFMSNTIGPDYFRTLRIPVMAGRAFEDRDDDAAAPVAVVNMTFAQRFWGSAANGIGKRVHVGDGEWRTVIGVAGDVKYSRINESPRPYVYLPFLQSYRSSMILQTHGAAPVDLLVKQARDCVAALDRDMPILYARSMPEERRGALILFDLTASMLFVFGAAGMALAAMGTYGLVSYLARHSTHEIGIRMALGASGRSVVLALLGRGLRLGAIGAAIGVVAALAAGRLLGSALFGVSATDVISFARALTVVLGGVVVASLVPAWRAARVNPLTALRHQ